MIKVYNNLIQNAERKEDGTLLTTVGIFCIHAGEDVIIDF